MKLKLLRKPQGYEVCSVITALAGMLFGLDTGIIGPVTDMPQFTAVIGTLSATIHGLVVSTILIPAALASFFAGHLADIVGRKRAICIGTAIFGIGCALEAGAVNLAMLICGRVITGIGEGLFLSTLVVYICEISPPRQRGLLASVPQLVITFGIMAGYFVCYGSVNIPSSIAWRLPFILQSVIAFTFSLVSFFTLSESPRWLTSVGRHDESKATWERLGVSETEREKATQQDQAQDRAENDAPSSTNQDSQKKRSQILKVFGPKVWKRTLLGAFLMGMQQLSGIDGVLYYAPLLFQQAGLSSSQASFLASGISALVIFCVTIPAMIFSDNWGRRTSTIWGGIGLFTTMVIIGSLYASDSVHGTFGTGRWVVIVMIYIFAVIYSISWAVGIKVYASEIQPPETRAAATSLAYSSNWIVNWTVAFTTPIFLAASSYGVYFLFGGATLLTVIVCTAWMPETRGRTLEVINESFEKRNTKPVGSHLDTIRSWVSKRASRSAGVLQMRSTSDINLPVMNRSLEDALVT